MNTIKTTLLSLVALLALTDSTLYAKSTIGGIIFTNLYYSDTQSKTQDDPTTVRNEHDVSKFNVIVPNNSRLRVRWDNEDNVGMYFEMGYGSTGMKVRHAYGKWDVNEQWQILAGQTSTPFAPLNPQVAMVHNSGDGFGNTNPSRQSQLRFTYKFLNRQGAIALAILDPNSGETYDDGATSSNDKLQNAGSIPRVDLGAVFKNFNIQVFPGVFYSRASFEDGILDDVNVWGASLGVRTAFSAITLAMEVGTGENWGNTKMGDVKTIHNNMTVSNEFKSNSRTSAVYNSTSTLVDNAILKGWVDLGYRFAGDTLKGEFHIIGGYDKTNASDDTLNQEYENTMYGVSVPFDFPWIARGFRLRPEVFHFVEKQIDSRRGDANREETIAGVQVQFTF